MFVISKENLKTLNYHMFLKKHEVFLLFVVSVVMNVKKIKEEESIQMLKFLGLNTNIEEYRKMYNHDCWKHKFS